MDKAFRDAGDELAHIEDTIRTEGAFIMAQYHIPCNHQHASDVADHYPLTTQEIIDLLEMARATAVRIDSNPDKATQTIASIQVRLAQGIPGLTCPRQIDGPVAKKLNALDSAYVDWLENPLTLIQKYRPITRYDQIVVTLTNLMK